MEFFGCSFGLFFPKLARYSQFAYFTVFTLKLWNFEARNRCLKASLHWESTEICLGYRRHLLRVMAFHGLIWDLCWHFFISVFSLNSIANETHPLQNKIEKKNSQKPAWSLFSIAITTTRNVCHLGSISGFVFF